MWLEIIPVNWQIVAAEYIKVQKVTSSRCLWVPVMIQLGFTARYLHVAYLIQQTVPIKNVHTYTEGCTTNSLYSVARI